MTLESIISNIRVENSNKAPISRVAKKADIVIFDTSTVGGRFAKQFFNFAASGNIATHSMIVGEIERFHRGKCYSARKEKIARIGPGVLYQMDWKNVDYEAMSKTERELFDPYWQLLPKQRATIAWQNRFDELADELLPVAAFQPDEQVRKRLQKTRNEHPEKHTKVARNVFYPLLDKTEFMQKREDECNKYGLLITDESLRREYTAIFLREFDARAFWVGFTMRNRTLAQYKRSTIMKCADEADLHLLATAYRRAKAGQSVVMYVGDSDYLQVFELARTKRLQSDSN